MQLREPRRKTFALVNKVEGRKPATQLQGTFNGFCVLVEATQEARDALEASCYGKPNLSRGYSNLKKADQIIRKRQFETRKKFSDETAKPERVIVMPDSDSEDENYFTKEIKPVYEIDRSRLKERIHLDLSEAYFLNKYTQRLVIQQDGVSLSSQECWEKFCSEDKYFTQNYICYHHFRRKNWVVRTGLKFGGDFLLYKTGPAYYHASYVVIIDILDENTLERKPDLCRRSMNTRDITGLNRLCEGTGKELLIFQIFWPNNVEHVSNDDIKHIQVKEILMRRWDPKSKQLN